MANGRYVLVDEDFQIEVLGILHQLLHGKVDRPADKPKELMDTADAIAYMKVTRRSLYKYRKMGLPFERFAGGKIYYRQQQIDEFLKKNVL